MDIAQLTTFLGWCTVINLALLLVAVAAITLLRDRVLAVHGKVLGLGPEVLMPIYVKFLAQFKILLLMFNLVPWLALKVM